MAISTLEVGFEDGAAVHKGDVLYRLDSVRYVAKVAECKALLAYARQSYERHGRLLESRAVSQDAADNVLAQRDSAAANLAAAEAELVVARDRLRHCTITAPFDGQIRTAVRRVGSFVMDDPDTWPLVDLVQTDPIRVRFALSNGDYLRMFDGDLANLRSNAVVDVWYFKSTSNAKGNYSCTVMFRPGVNPDIALVNVQNAVKRAEKKLPAEGVASSEVMRLIESTPLPKGYKVEWGRVAAQEKENEGQLAKLLALSVLFAYLFHVAQYASWSVPLAVMLSTVVSIAGAFLGLWLTGTPLSIYAQRGRRMERESVFRRDD